MNNIKKRSLKGHNKKSAEEKARDVKYYQNLMEKFIRSVRYKLASVENIFSGLD
jgi:hypothetical protein